MSTIHLCDASYAGIDRGSNLQPLTSLVASPPSVAAPLTIIPVSPAVSERKRKRSGVWQHFSLSGERAACKYCSTVYVYKWGSTGNLWRHMRSEHPSKLDAAVGSSEGFHAAPYSEESFRDCLLHWIIAEAMPFTAVEAPSFRTLLRCLKPEAPILSANSLRRDMDWAYEREFMRMRSLLHEAPGKLSFTVDGRTSPDMGAFLGITVHWIDSEWRLREALLDLAPLSGLHNGENLASVFVAACDKFGILPKILAITTDDAAVNDVLLRGVAEVCAERKIAFSKKEGHVRCAAHVLNIAVQALLEKLHAEATEVEEECLASDSQVSTLASVQKLRKLIARIRASPQRVEKLARQCEASGVPKRRALMDVKNRWGSTYKMLERAMLLREPLTHVAASEAELCGLILTDDEWRLVAEIRWLLQVFEGATEMICASKRPTLTSAIPIYNALIRSCEEFAEGSAESGILSGAVGAARSKLCAYYAKADAAAYSVATIIDPRVKLEYYRYKGWEGKRIREAKDAIKRTFDSYHVPAQHEEVRPQEDVGRFPLARVYGHWRANSNDELEDYLSREVSDSLDLDVLQWWRVHSGPYPRLSCLARDYLAVPSTSAPAERAFSKGAWLMDTKRASLSAETVEICMCLQSWMQQFP